MMQKWVLEAVFPIILNQTVVFHRKTAGGVNETENTFSWIK